MVYQLCLRLQNADQVKRQELISYVCRSKNTAWVAEVEGNFDIAIISSAKNQLEIKEFIDDLFKKFGQHIMKKTLSINLEGRFFPRDYLIDKKREISKESKYASVKETIILDSTDRRILSLLAENSRSTAVELAKKLILSAETIVSRLKKLRKSEIILDYTVVLNQEKLDQLHFKILLYLNTAFEEKIKKLLAQLQSNNKVIAIIKSLAEWDYEIDIEVQQTAELRAFLTGLTNDFPEVIRDYSFLQVTKMHKYNFYRGITRNALKC